jgi:hypothetical protein
MLSTLDCRVPNLSSEPLGGAWRIRTADSLACQARAGAFSPVQAGNFEIAMRPLCAVQVRGVLGSLSAFLSAPLVH